MTISGYTPPAALPANSSIGFWSRRKHASEPDRGNIPKLVDGYIDFLDKHENKGGVVFIFKKETTKN